MTPELAHACERAIHVLTRDGRTLRAGRASMFLLGHLGYRRTAAVLSIPPLIWCVELGYWIVARNRVLFSKFLFTKE